MARLVNNQDVYAVVNALAKQVLGAQAATVNAVTFTDIGTQLANMPTDAIIDGLSMVIGVTEVPTKRYNAKFKLIQDEGIDFADISRKISYYMSAAEASKFDNFSNTSDYIGQGKYPTYQEEYAQDLPHIVELIYSKKNSWSKRLTIISDQIAGSFESPAAFMAFWNGHIAAFSNDVEFEKEQYNREVALELIAGTALTDESSVQGNGGLIPDGGGARYTARSGSRVKLVTMYNEMYTSGADSTDPTKWETWDQIKKNPEHLKKFTELFILEAKRVSDTMPERSVLYHVNPFGEDGVAGSASIEKKLLPRWTEKADQRMFLINDFYRRTQVQLMPTLFHPDYFGGELEKFEKVECWQNIKTPYSFKVKAPTLVTTLAATGDPVLSNSSGTLDLTGGNDSDHPGFDKTVTPGEGGAADTTTYAYVGEGVLAVIFDKEACRSGFKYEKAITTPQSASRDYRNTHYHMVKASKLDQTENAVVFTLE